MSDVQCTGGGAASSGRHFGERVDISWGKEQLDEDLVSLEDHGCKCGMGQDGIRIRYGQHGAAGADASRRSTAGVLPNTAAGLENPGPSRISSPLEGVEEQRELRPELHEGCCQGRGRLHRSMLAVVGWGQV